jgi:hypothetical protein
MNTEKIGEEKEQAIKITISKEAAEGLTEIRDRVNEGFEAGKVHRQDIASWIISKFSSSCTDHDIQEIRFANYDEIAMLESLYRRAKETGKVPDHLKEVLRKQFSAPEPVRKGKKLLTKGYINDVPLKNEEAA